jgi:hypothetical protein
MLTAFILEFWGNNNSNAVIGFAGDCLKWLVLYPKRKCAKTIVTGVVYLDMLEEFLILTLEAEGPNSCYSTRLQLVPLCFHISNFQLKISMEMNWQRQPFCLTTSCHWPQTKMCCLHFIIALLRLSGRLWDAVAVPTMLPDVWTRPQCQYDTYWTTYCALFEHLWVNCCKCGSQLNHITCKYMFSLHSLACYFSSSIAFKLSTFYVFTFF